MQIRAGIQVYTLAEIAAKVGKELRTIHDVQAGTPESHVATEIVQSQKLWILLSSLLSPQLLRRRDLEVQNDALVSRNYAASFTAQPITRSILENASAGRVIVTRHPLQGAWDGPFFFEDSRHVFFVTTTDQPVWVHGYQKYGILGDAGVIEVAKIPPLVFHDKSKIRVESAPWRDGQPICPDTDDPVSMQRFVTEDAYIHRGIGTIAVMRYGDQEIGPSGAIGHGRSTK
jgi:hypothetical protein